MGMATPVLPGMHPIDKPVTRLTGLPVAARRVRHYHMVGMRVPQHQHLHHSPQAGVAQAEVPGSRTDGGVVPELPLRRPGHGRPALLRPF